MIELQIAACRVGGNMAGVLVMSEGRSGVGQSRLVQRQYGCARMFIGCVIFGIEIAKHDAIRCSVDNADWGVSFCWAVRDPHPR